ncbi:zf-HC2 domain-containing protein [Cystobacter fuscus]|uniref:anti-sigma factor family protein n=1 Tax=Cystobacter fuscus TaxID=43 RepID=UPI002B296828|nr:zf-HC2 domain-containing protein [Cystobacter fuscus]
MSACQDMAESLTLFATGALEPHEETRVRAHLDTCAACRREVSALQDTLGLAALPTLSPREQAVLEVLPQTTVSRWRRDQVRRATHLRTTGALMAAAAVLLLLLRPGMSPRTPSPSTPPASPVAASSTEEDVLALEQWALADPLSDALDLTDVDLEDAPESSSSWDVEAEEFLSSPSLGESL